MKRDGKIAIIALIGFVLASCSIEGGHQYLIISEEDDSVSSLGTSSTSYLSSESTTSEEEHSSLTSYTLSSKLTPPGSGTSPFSSAEKTFYTVSVYQCYYVQSSGTYGNPRFDFSLQAEANKPLYSGSNDVASLRTRCHPVYTPIGGTYTVNCFYSDEQCMRFISSMTTVSSNMNIYYYCDG